MALWDGRFVVESLHVGALAANCVCVADVAEGVAAIFDPGDNAPAIVDTLLRRTVDPKIMGGRGAADADASASPSAPSPPISATSAATTAASTAATAANTAAVPQSQNQHAEPSPKCDGVRVRVVMIVLTHSHMDHCLAVPQLKKMFPDAKARCTFPPSTVELCRETAVAMKCTSGQIVFIVEKMYDDTKSEVAFSVQQSSSSGGLVHGLYNDLNIVNENRWARMLWEVTESLFSVYNPVLSTVDVWDCNDLIGGATGANCKPKTTIEHVGAAPIAGGGFIFHVTSDTLQVVEPSSGLVVAGITFALPGCNVILARYDIVDH
ncbi:hypothetical protein Pelo_5805 [Pelomyxa schiedti]|nr:hypothetical protein Pelo_5805 [Pelomyxa schiedti]